jgi:serine/threonine protein kinase
VIFDVLGTPSDEDVSAISDPRGRKLLEMEAKRDPVESLSYRYRGAPVAFLTLLEQLLTFNPKKRMTVNEALADPLFADIRNKQEEIVAPNKLTGDFDSSSSSSAAPAPPAAAPPLLNPNAKPFSFGETLSHAASALLTPWAPAAVQQLAPKTNNNSAPPKLNEQSLRLLIAKEVAAYV